MSLRICDVREESKNEYALFLLACLGGIVAVCAATMFLFTFFDALRWNVADPEKFQSNLWVQWSAFTMIVGAIVSGCALMWKWALGRVECFQMVERPTYYPTKWTRMYAIGCILASNMCIIGAFFWAPMLFTFAAVGCSVAAGSYCYEWRRCVAHVKCKNEAPPKREAAEG